MPKLIINESDFIDQYEYLPKHAMNNLPERYPCIMVKEHVDAGLSGNHVEHHIHYIPDDEPSIYSYYNGFKVGFKMNI
jgi:hypothetical protein